MGPRFSNEFKITVNGMEMLSRRTGACKSREMPLCTKRLSFNHSCYTYERAPKTSSGHRLIT